MLNEIYRQVTGFLQAGKKLQPPKDSFDAFLSRLAGVILIIITALLYFFVFTAPYVPLRIHIRAIILLLPLLGAISVMLKGVSFYWIIRGLCKYWIPTSILALMWIVVIYMMYSIFFGGTLFTLSLLGGTMMICASLVIGGSSYMKVRKILKADDDKLGGELTLHLFNVLVWLAFFIGGLVMIASGLGIIDWFFQNVLGW